tara:strand:- start:2501 stop:3187 length:687 start_codon:yes stop_codon:yes gene_type:complete
MNIAICVSGVNNKDSGIVEQLDRYLPGCNFYFHTFSNKTNLIPEQYHNRLFTMHYPKWHYHPMEVEPYSKHAKFEKYVKTREMNDDLYFGIVPLLAHADLVTKIPVHHDLIIRVDWNTQIDRQVDLHNWLRKAYDQGPVGFMTRPKRGPKFGSGLVEEVDKTNPHDDWYGFLPSDVIIHHRKHFNRALLRQLVNEAKLYPNEWGWYQVMSEWTNDIHTSIHGFAKRIN